MFRLRGCTVALRLPKAVMVSSAFTNVFQHKSFPLTEKRPVISPWNAGNAASLTLARALAIELRPITRYDGYHPGFTHSSG